jgi:hypothetical protein
MAWVFVGGNWGAGMQIYTIEVMKGQSNGELESCHQFPGHMQAKGPKDQSRAEILGVLAKLMTRVALKLPVNAERGRLVIAVRMNIMCSLSEAFNPLNLHMRMLFLLQEDKEQEKRAGKRSKGHHRRVDVN